MVIPLVDEQMETGTVPVEIQKVHLTNALATFCTLTNQVFREYLDQSVVVYLDDIVVFSSSLEEYQRINFLGHVIECEKIQMDEDKLQAIKKWRAPTSVIELCSFFELANYFHRFIRGFSRKVIMTMGLVLGFVDVSKSFVVKTDTLDFVLGGSPFMVKYDNTAICRFFCQPKLTSKQARLYVPRARDLRKKLLHECQDTLWAGHPGWKVCLICQQDKVEKVKVTRFLEPLLIPTRPWENASMDFITHLSKVGDLEVILVITDQFSKYTTFISTTKLCSAKSTAHLFFKYVVKLWKVPTSIMSDWNGRFIGTF
ncbi:reverse transcriptase [Cucumis melo var. makuwa]|uniref:Reverse transcriptase n=1 Tax=Cucumis melo var. makuwa TaxID=1194695 RepID=A0A5A7UII1_CUCMM|nr:reverse transcriptase [Cucumis melo var. makuwa]